MKRPSRRGMSLLEVILATGILLGAAVVLFELASIGRAHIESAEDLAAAQQICQTRLNEMLAGAAPIRVAENEPLEEGSEWAISVQLDTVGHMPGLSALRVSVARDASPGHRAKRYTLVRWIRNPYAGQPSAPFSSPATHGSPSGAEALPETQP